MPDHISSLTNLHSLIALRVRQTIRRDPIGWASSCGINLRPYQRGVARSIAACVGYPCRWTGYKGFMCKVGKALLKASSKKRASKPVFRFEFLQFQAVNSHPLNFVNGANPGRKNAHKYDLKKDPQILSFVPSRFRAVKMADELMREGAGRSAPSPHRRLQSIPKGQSYRWAAFTTLSPNGTERKHPPRGASRTC